jgi:hypothetical protein
MPATLRVVILNSSTVLLTCLQVEFDSPKILLKNKQGMLRTLVDASGDRDTLYKIAMA